MEIKVKMHTVLNRIAYFVLFPMFAVFGVLIYKDAANEMARVFGIVMIVLLFLFTNWVFLFKLCVFDYAIFKANTIELYSPWKKKAEYTYAEVIVSHAEYTSMIERKEYLTFTDKKYNTGVTRIDTSKHGNTPKLNKMKVVYVPAKEEMLALLRTKSDLLWYNG